MIKEENNLSFSKTNERCLLEQISQGSENKENLQHYLPEIQCSLGQCSHSQCSHSQCSLGQGIEGCIKEKGDARSSNEKNGENNTVTKESLLELQGANLVIDNKSIIVMSREVYDGLILLSGCSSGSTASCSSGSTASRNNGRQIDTENEGICSLNNNLNSFSDLNNNLNNTSNLNSTNNLNDFSNDHPSSNIPPSQKKGDDFSKKSKIGPMKGETEIDPLKMKTEIDPLKMKTEIDPLKMKRKASIKAEMLISKKNKVYEKQMKEKEEEMKENSQFFGIKKRRGESEEMKGCGIISKRRMNWNDKRRNWNDRRRNGENRGNDNRNCDENAEITLLSDRDIVGSLSDRDIISGRETNLINSHREGLIAMNSHREGLIAMNSHREDLIAVNNKETGMGKSLGNENDQEENPKEENTKSLRTLQEKGLRIPGLRILQEVTNSPMKKKNRITSHQEWDDKGDRNRENDRNVESDRNKESDRESDRRTSGQLNCDHNSSIINNPLKITNPFFLNDTEIKNVKNEFKKRRIHKEPSRVRGREGKENEGKLLEGKIKEKGNEILEGKGNEILEGKGNEILEGKRKGQGNEILEGQGTIEILEGQGTIEILEGKRTTPSTKEKEKRTVEKEKRKKRKYKKLKERNTRFNGRYKFVELKRKAIINLYKSPTVYWSPKKKKSVVLFDPNGCVSVHNRSSTPKSILVEEISPPKEFSSPAKKEVVEVIRKLDFGSEGYFM